jgi:hypothetical protein
VDNIILFREAVHSSCTKGDNGTMIKIDMDNTFA